MSKQDRNYRGDMRQRDDAPIDKGNTPPNTKDDRPARRQPTGKQEPCPICFAGELNGIGQSEGLYRKASTLHKRYFKCDRCGHTWSHEIRPEQVINATNRTV